MTRIPSFLKTMTVAARTTTPGTAQSISAWCVQAGITELDLQGRDPALNGSEAASLPMPDLLIIEQFTDEPEAIERLEAIAREMPETTVTVFILADPSATELRRLFHAGANDVLSSAITEPELFAAFDAALSDGERIASGARSTGKLISILKTAGGVGATSVAANLARTLQEQKAGSIVVVDLDVQFAGLTACLDLKPRLTLIDAVRAGERLDPTLLRSLFTQHESGFQILAGPSEITATDALTPDFMSALTVQLKSEFDVVIFDMPMAWSDWFADVLSHTDLIMPVLQPNVRSADGARRTLDALEDIGLGEHAIQPVINGIDRTPDAKARSASLSGIFQGKPSITIRDDHKAFQRAADLGKCLIDLGGTTAQQDFTYAARKTADVLDLDVEIALPTQGERKLGLKLFGEKR